MTHFVKQYRRNIVRHRPYVLCRTTSTGFYVEYSKHKRRCKIDSLSTRPKLYSTLLYPNTCAPIVDRGVCSIIVLTIMRFTTYFGALRVFTTFFLLNLTFRYNCNGEAIDRLLVILKITVYFNTGTKWEVVVTMYEIPANDMIMDDNKQSNLSSCVVILLWIIISSTQNYDNVITTVKVYSISNGRLW